MAATTQQNPANQFVLEERDGNIVTLRLNRPDRLERIECRACPRARACADTRWRR